MLSSFSSHSNYTLRVGWGGKGFYECAKEEGKISSKQVYFIIWIATLPL